MTGPGHGWLSCDTAGPAMKYPSGPQTQPALALVARCAQVGGRGVRGAVSVRTPQTPGTVVGCVPSASRRPGKVLGAAPRAKRRLECSASGCPCQTLGGAATVPAQPGLERGNQTARPPVPSCAAHVLRPGTVAPCQARCQRDGSTDTGRKAHQRNPQRGLEHAVLQGSFCQPRRDAG